MAKNHKGKLRFATSIANRSHTRSGPEYASSLILDFFSLPGSSIDVPPSIAEKPFSLDASATGKIPPFMALSDERAVHADVPNTMAALVYDSDALSPRCSISSFWSYFRRFHVRL